MKFALNGALTIGTLDGANIEIREQVGAENFFLFGLTADEVFALRAQGYNPRDYYDRDAELRAVLERLLDGTFGERSLFAPLVEALLQHDEYMLLADYRAYLDAQTAVDQAYQEPARWTRMSILNTARCGFFSSDRTIQQYAAEIWQVKPLRLPAD
jgi:glycogen phosphorylase